MTNVVNEDGTSLARLIDDSSASGGSEGQSRQELHFG